MDTGPCVRSTRERLSVQNRGDSTEPTIARTHAIHGTKFKKFCQRRATANQGSSFTKKTYWNNPSEQPGNRCQPVVAFNKSSTEGPQRRKRGGTRKKNKPRKLACEAKIRDLFPHVKILWRERITRRSLVQIQPPQPQKTPVGVLNRSVKSRQ